MKEIKVMLVKTDEKKHSSVYKPEAGTPKENAVVSSVYFLRDPLPNPTPSRILVTLMFEEGTNASAFKA